MSLAEAADSIGTRPGDWTALDAVVTELRQGVERWVALPLRERAQLLEDLHAAIVPQAASWARTVADIKGLSPRSPLVGEEWMRAPLRPWPAPGALARSAARLGAGLPPLEGVTFGIAPGRSGRSGLFPSAPSGPSCCGP